jgi:hypothetical protein
MKTYKNFKCLMTLALIALSVIAYAQPQGIGYQAVIRNAQAVAIQNSNITVRFSIQDATGRTLYQEQHSTTANEVGQVNLVIGKGTALVGKFDTIHWEQIKPTLLTEVLDNGTSRWIRQSQSDFMSVPYALYSAGDKTGKVVGTVQIFGFNEGAAIVRGSDWQSVTRTNYDKIESSFPTPVTPGMTREYWLSIRKADDVNDCAGPESLGRNAMGAEWRFYFDWKNKTGHKFQTGRDWGGLEQGRTDWIKVPEIGAFAEAGGPAPYWRLDARINSNCPNRAMAVYGIWVTAIDKPNGQQPTVNLDTDNNRAKESSYALGGISNRMTLTTNALQLKTGEKTLSISTATTNGDVTNPQGIAYYEMAGSEYHMFGGDVIGDAAYRNLGLSNWRWNNVYANTGNFSSSISVNSTNNANTLITPGFLSTRTLGGKTLVNVTSTVSNDGYIETIAPNGNRLAAMSSSSANPNGGWLGIFDVGINNSSENPKAGFYVDAQGKGHVFADSKNFRMEHPKDPEKEIWYASLEGPEAGAYERGTAKIVNGEVTVTFSEHFQLVGNMTTMTVILTPLSADSKGLAVVEKTATGFKIKELGNGTGSYGFDWEVKAVRKGYEDYKVIRPKGEAMPSAKKAEDEKGK